MTRAMNTLILSRAHYRRRYGNDAPEMSTPSRFLEEVPSQLVENLGRRSPAWSTPSANNRASGYGPGRRPSQFGEFSDQHYNYEDESQESGGATASSSRSNGSRSEPSKPFVASWMTPKAKPVGTSGQVAGGSEGSEGGSFDNIARFFGGKGAALKPGALGRPAMTVPGSSGAHNLQKGQRVRHSKYGEGTILMREGEGEDAKLTVMFARHGMKKLIEKFANLEKI
jgi:DNA helicase-2/ATP-dependent DNA helicase PcrA